MKISYLEIRAYHQFKDFTLCLTYPKGHEKEGMPLDKVCLIGQSGTGKTSLLNICRAFVTRDASHASSDMRHIMAVSYLKGGMKVISTLRHGRLVHEYPDERESENMAHQREYWEERYPDTNILISFPAEINTNLNQILQEKNSDNPMDYLKTDSELAKEPGGKGAEDRIFDFERNNVLEVWNRILKDINDYKVEDLKYGQRTTKALNISIEEGERVFEEFRKWKKDCPNPLENLAHQLNPILNKFYLKIKKDFDFESADDLKFVKITTLSGVEVPYNGWSTGTKQVILTATPIFKLDTKDTVILIDEPERSLYPDIQTGIVDDYTRLAPRAQFFFATHSPIIASSFEPWEIVELRFGKDGHVYREKYYEGEDHVRNYSIDPRFLRWDGILMHIFDLKVEGNEAFRTKALTKACRLNAKLKKLRAESRIETEEGRKTLAEFEWLAQKLAWRFDEKS